MNFPKINLLPILFREIFFTSYPPREPEPEVMDDPAAVDAFTHAGRAGGTAEAYYLFYCARACLVLQGARRVLDVGCGPGTHLVKLAKLHPETSFVGLDLSEPMLQEARRHAVECGVRNVEFVKGDATHLEYGDASFDGVMSIMTLHQMPDEQSVECILREVSRVLKPDGALFMVDFGRLKSSLSMQAFAHEKADRQSDLLTRDYERSLRAAFRLEDYQKWVRELLPSAAHIVSSFILPMLVMIKTEDRPIPHSLKERLRAMAEELPRSQKRDFEEVRMFLRLGGLTNDPF